jgi:hypothetical protein
MILIALFSGLVGVLQEELHSPNKHRQSKARDQKPEPWMGSFVQEILEREIHWEARAVGVPS